MRLRLYFIFFIWILGSKVRLKEVANSFKGKKLKKMGQTTEI